jgi:hypothetical protein
LNVYLGEVKAMCIILMQRLGLFHLKKILRRSQGHVHHFNAEARAFPLKKNT